MTSTTPTQFPNQHKKERHKEDGQERGSQHAAEDTGSDGVAAGCARAGGEDQRHNAKNKRHRGHHDRPKPNSGGFHRGINQGMSGFIAFVGKLDDHSDGETAETPHVLSADVVAFTTRYRDPRDGTWKDEWKETKVIPSALEFTVGFASDNGASSLPIVVTRAVELPSSTYAMQSIGQPVNQRNSTNAVQRRDVPLANPPASGGKPRGSRR